ncbi:hypothetical protein KIN20_020391 [Parelaphostrongylus tenuis]|uniref:GATA-type domain-containing protein n=1 Tax=Parelaphostrongylus tenuis TaxID=148309 RepID=A0AAD5QTH3_PARTN|nr:hypothetical protein KIN20_020391 [Parelaphostrongylus tenuis]
MDAIHSSPGNSIEYGPPLNINQGDDNRFSAIDLYHIPNQLAKMATVTVTVHKPLVSPGTSPANIARNLQQHHCEYSLYVQANKPPRTGVVEYGIVCTNCGTETTSKWRRGDEGRIECNACNVYFRMYGRKSPASMRRDTIVRRRRFPYHHSSDVAHGSKSAHFGNLQKAATYQYQNSVSSSEATITQNNIAQPFNLSKPQSTASQNFFAPSSSDFTHSQPTFTLSNVYYNTQNPMMMSYTAGGNVFSAINSRRQLSPSVVNDQHTFSRQSRSTSVGCDVFGGQMLATFPNETLNVMKLDTDGEMVSLSGNDTEGFQKKECQSAIENLIKQEPVETHMFHDDQCQNQYSEAIKESS